MSRVCDICGRGTMTGNSRSHSNIASKRKFAINLQSRKIDGKTVRLCTKCLKTKSKPKREKPVRLSGQGSGKAKTAKKA